MDTSPLSIHLSSSSPVFHPSSRAFAGLTYLGTNSQSFHSQNLCSLAVNLSISALTCCDCFFTSSLLPYSAVALCRLLFASNNLAPLDQQSRLRKKPGSRADLLANVQLTLYWVILHKICAQSTVTSYLDSLNKSLPAESQLAGGTNRASTSPTTRNGKQST